MRAKILYLSHRVPYPPNKGDKIRSYHHIRYLADSHDVHLVSFVDSPDDWQWADALREYCQSVQFVPLNRPRALIRASRALVQGRSLSEAYFGAAAMWRAVRHTTASQAFDMAWAYCTQMAPYMAGVSAARRVLDCGDVDSEKWNQFAAHYRNPWRLLYKLEATRLREVEKRFSAVADCVLFVSAEEASMFRTFTPPTTTVHVIPNGVDTSFFRPVHNRGVAANTDLLFSGTLDYRPNVDAILFFVRSVLPLVHREIPTVRLTAVGHRPRASLRWSTRRFRDHTTIVGSVPDVRPYFAATRVYVAPLRLGRGVQNKILEAMAMGVPVVASPLAAQGLAVQNHTHLTVADTPSAFAAAIVGLLRKPEWGQRLADRALQLVRERYRWDANLRMLDVCFNVPKSLSPRHESGALPETLT